MKACFCLFLSFLTLLGCTTPSVDLCRHTENVRAFLLSLDAYERYFLEFFFRSLIQDDSIGYVLLGGKPMGFYSYLRPKTFVNAYPIQSLENLDLFFAGLSEENALFHKGWEIWKQHAPRFCGKNLFFDFMDQDLELHYAKVAVINKRLLLAVSVATLAPTRLQKIGYLRSPPYGSALRRSSL